MKIRFAILVCLIMSLSLLIACSAKNDQQNSGTAAKNLLSEIYTVDSKTIQNFNLSPSNVNMPSEPTSIKNINEKFRKNVTNDVSPTIENLYIDFIKSCQYNRTIMSPTEVKIKLNSHDNDIYQYDFTSSVKITYLNTKKTSDAEESGQICVKKENGENGVWVISFLSVTNSKILKILPIR